MAFPQGVNFRKTAGFVTDGANEDKELTELAADYPVTTAQGNTIGWEATNFGTGLQNRDRNSENDRRLAGSSSNNLTTETQRFRIDLPAAGNYKVGVATGDANYTTTSKVVLFDTLTQLSVLVNGTTSAAQRFFDATGTEYTNVTWPTSQTLVQFAFSTTILRLIADGVTRLQLCHLYVESADPSPSKFPPPNKLRPRIFAPGLAR